MREAWDTYFSFLNNSSETNPAIIEKMIENGVFKRVLTFLCEKIVPVQKSFVNVISFLNISTSNEHVFTLIKESLIFEKYMLPTSDDLFKKMAIVTSIA